VTDGIGTT
jgi:hypothetical protein